MKAVGYIRVSSTKDGQQESPQNQKDIIMQFIQQNNFDFHDFYVDKVTGTTGKRPQLQQMIHDAKEHKFDVIVLKDLTRLGRNVELLYQLKRLAENNDVRIITTDGTIDTNDTSKMLMFGMLAVLAESESQRTSERIKSVFKVKRQSGKFLGSKAPFGYDVVDGQLYPNEYATIVQEIYTMYLSGHGFRYIAYNLTERGIPTPAQILNRRSNGMWQVSTVKLILKNQHYVGDMVQGKQTTKSVTNKTVQLVDKKDWDIVENTHEAIISRDVFDQTQQRLQNRATKGKVKAKKHLFTNILFCHDCGNALWKKYNNVMYVCGSYARYGKRGCSNHSIREDVLSEIVLNDLKALYDRMNTPNVSALVARQLKAKNKQATKRLQVIENEIAHQNKLKQSALEKLISDVISKSDYDMFVDGIQNTLTALNIEKQALEAQLQSNDTTIMVKLQSLLEPIVAMDTITREMIDTFVKRIEIKEDKSVVIHYNFKNPFDCE